ncbi:hypothetical protein CXB51_017835 [Gossypium anomalum]|uniref:Condensin complex subunit 2 n=1 Tax=Gossypium anomalum TaxID=47600 RepID=A0A8J6CYN8_9ROSI|nr:hypothetical protein CXB51_017835 [Gossypium anomalum]
MGNELRAKSIMKRRPRFKDLRSRTQHLATRLGSLWPLASSPPTSPFFLGSNDGKLERAQAQAARVAAIRRKPVLSHPQSPTDSDPCLSKDQILELFQNCIKLASENVEEENDVETSFQKASCTLEAGVKIYSLSVDLVHSEAYKVLGGINRAGQENEQDSVVENGNVDTTQEVNPKKETDKRLVVFKFKELSNSKFKLYSNERLCLQMSPLSTLESSFEALNVKKFDVAFAVDPLYHQTSAQFDEGGAKGLLLNNLGVYAGCRVLFDSSEVPGKEIPSSNQHDISETIDLSFAGEYLERMVLNMQTKDEISPTLHNMVNQFYEENRRPLENVSCSQRSTELADIINNESEFDGVAFESFDNDGFDHDDQPSIVDEEFNREEPTFTSYHEVLRILLMKKIRKCQLQRKPKIRNKLSLIFDFTKALDNEMPDIFAPPQNLNCFYLQTEQLVIQSFLKIVTINLRTLSNCFLYPTRSNVYHQFATKR